MSAYIVSRNHILYLIGAACSHQITRNYGFSWYHAGEHHRLDPSNREQCADVANMLWRENMASVSARYPNETSATLPGPLGKGAFDPIAPTDFAPVLWDAFNPVDVLKAVGCYRYQSCEHDGWETSEAFTFCRNLEHACICALPGWEDAEWGCPDTLAEKRAKYRKTKLCAQSE